MLVIGDTEDLVLPNVGKPILYAILNLIREPIAKKMGNDDWGQFQDDFIASMKCLELDELPTDSFNLACQLILSSKDDLIEPWIPDLKPLFEQDTRFKSNKIFK